MWRSWCAEHPATILYILVVTTLNLLLNAVEVMR